MSVKKTGKGMKGGKEMDQKQFHFHFSLSPDPDDILSVEGGSQQALSDFEFRLRSVMKTVLDDVSKRDVDSLDRFEVAARMSRKLGREISKSHLDQWTAHSAIQRRMHVDAMKALCEVTGDWRVLHFFVESCGFKALDPVEAMCAEFGAQSAIKAMIDGKLKDIKSEIETPEVVARLMARIVKGEKR